MKLGPWALLSTIRKRGVVVMFPTYLNGQWWTVAGSRFFRKAMNDVCQRYPIDKSRTVIAGCSNGATGAWALSKANSQEFRGVVSISGAFDSTEAMMATKGPPVYIVHGARDTVIDVKFSRAAHKALARNRPGTVYKEYPDEGHLIFFTRGGEILAGAFEWIDGLFANPPGAKPE